MLQDDCLWPPLHPPLSQWPLFEAGGLQQEGHCPVSMQIAEAGGVGWLFECVCAELHPHSFPWCVWHMFLFPRLSKEFVCAELPGLESAAKGGQLVECNEACREAQAAREAQEKALAIQKAEKKEAKKKLKEGKAGAATPAANAPPDAGKQGGLRGRY